MEDQIQCGEENIVYQGRIIEVVQQKVVTGNKEKILEFARRSPGVRLIILTPEGGLLLTKEFRREFNRVDHRLPGGKVFDTLAEYNDFLKGGADILSKAKEAAEKEALEETGIIVEDITHFFTSKVGATIVWDLFYFVVRKYQDHPRGQHLEDDESIEVVKVTKAEARRMCLDGRIQEERSAASLLRYLESDP